VTDVEPDPGLPHRRTTRDTWHNALHRRLHLSFDRSELVREERIREMHLLRDPPDVARARERLQGAIDQAEQAITEGRDAVQGLRSSTMISGDFAAAFHTLGAELATVGANQSPPALHVEGKGRRGN